MKKQWLLFALVLLFVFSPYHIFSNTQLEGESASHLAHAFSVGLDHNLNYQANLQEWSDDSGTRPFHAPGGGFLASLFVAPLALIDRYQELPVHYDPHQYQYSWSYFGLVLSASVFLIGGMLLYRYFLRSIGDLPDFYYILLPLSSGILLYALFKPFTSQAFEFFSIALICIGAKHAFSNRSIYSLLLWTGIFLSLLLEPSHIHVLLLPLIIWQLEQPNFSFAQLSKNQKKSFALSFALSFIPFVGICLVLYHFIYPVPDSLLYQFDGFYSLAGNEWLKIHQKLPQLGALLVSTLFTAPVIVIGVVALITCLLNDIRQQWRLLGLCCLYVLWPLFLVLYHLSPDDIYVSRDLLSLYPLAVVGFLLFHNTTLRHSGFIPQLIRSLALGCLFFGVLASAFFATSPALLFNSQQSNYSLNVAKSSISPIAWLNLAAKRTPGYLAHTVVSEREIAKVPLNDIDKAKAIALPKPPVRNVIQVVVILMLWLGTFATLLRLPKKPFS